MSKFIAASEIFDRLHAAGAFTDDPTYVRRVVIDLEHGSVAKIYVERFADAEALHIAFGAGITIEGDDKT